MNLTREECKNALIELFYDENGFMRDGLTYEFDLLEQLINEHFGNPEITSISAYRILKYKIDELEKALDKAIDELSGLDSEYAWWFNQMVDKHGLYSYREPKNKEQWKEYLLNED